MDKRQQLLEIFEAAIRAVQPDQSVLGHLSFRDSKLKADDAEYETGAGKIIVVGAGKGAAPMARALESLLGAHITKGHIVVKYGHELELGHMEISQAAHPVPDSAGEAAAARILELAGEAGPEDLLICLLTGGASALLPAPAEGLTLEDLQKTTSLLLASGATINEVNAVRKHLSRLSGGQLAKAANGARVLSIIVSDVIGDDPGAIASGPTYPDETTFRDCVEIIERYGLGQQLTEKVRKRLYAGAEGKVAETPKKDDPVFARVQNVIVASNSQALAAAAKKAEDLGYAVKIAQEPMTGEAREVARDLVRTARELSSRRKPGAGPICLLAGGETTVTLKGSGRGGRNQEMALAVAIEIVDQDNICALFAGTDGTDGPTDAAGGFAFGNTAAKMQGRAQDFLDNNDSNAALSLAGDQLVTGPTRTNVMDIAILLAD